MTQTEKLWALVCLLVLKNQFRILDQLEPNIVDFASFITAGLAIIGVLAWYLHEEYWSDDD